MQSRLRPLPCLLALAVLSTDAFAGVTVLGKPQFGTFATIQGAIDAASDGDVLLATPGSYQAFTIDAKSVTLIGQGVVTVNGSSTVKNVPERGAVGLVHLQFKGPKLSYGTASLPGLSLSASDGHVRVQDCSLVGGSVYDGFPSPPAGPAVSASACRQVVIANSWLTGGDPGWPSGELPVAGGEGLRSVDSSIALYDCSVRGGEGSQETSPSGGDGGVGATIQGWGVFASGCTITGGAGGGGDYIACTTSGNGGDGIVVDGAQLKLLDSPVAGGLPGNFGPCGFGTAGQAFAVTNAVVTTLPGVARKLDGPNKVADGASLPLTFYGAPGDKVWLVGAAQPGFRAVANYLGIACVPWPFHLTIQPLGVVGATGTLVVNVPIGAYSGPSAGWMWHLQGLVLNAGQKTYLATPLAVLVENL